jgi:hypothetical protein
MGMGIWQYLMGKENKNTGLVNQILGNETNNYYSKANFKKAIFLCFSVY